MIHQNFKIYEGNRAYKDFLKKTIIFINIYIFSNKFKQYAVEI